MVVHPEEEKIIEASEKQGLKTSKPGVSYKKQSLERLPKALRNYWEVKSSYLEEDDVTEKDVIRSGDIAFSYISKGLDETERSLENWISKPYKYYNYRIYPKIRDRRGATRLLKWLEKAAQIGLETVPENESTGIFELGDWDNLIIVDACRFDLFKEAFPEKNVEKRYSLGSSSADFVKKNFQENLDDVVAVTANPHYHNSNFDELTGRKVEDVFHTVYHTYETDWNEENGTVMPEPVVKDALNAEKMFPEERKIIHFMQPHHPFVGSSIDLDSNGFDQYLDPGEDIRDNFTGVWSLAELGMVDEDRVWKAYRDNLEFVMEYVEELVEGLDGTTVVTSDHGNLFGENGLYAHPSGLDAKAVKEVPVLRFEK